LVNSEETEVVICFVVGEGMGMNYQDFQIFVDKNNNIRASSEQGEVLSKLRWDNNQIQLSLQLIESGATNSELFKALGSQLYQALFPDKINARFEAAIAAAQGSQKKCPFTFNI